MSQSTEDSGLDGRHEIQAHLVATLQALQRVEKEAGAAVPSWSSHLTHLIQVALGVVSGGPEPEQPGQPEPSAVQPDQVPAFAAVLRDKRNAAGLTQEDLARRSGLSKRTISNIETSGQAPSRSTLVRLLAVHELRLAVTDFSADVAVDPVWAPNIWFAPQYNPSELMQDIVHLVNGPGGELEQTHLYIEPQSANDYMSLCTSSPVTVGFRAAAPLEQIAAVAVKRSAGIGLDIAALGSGDGQSEVRFVQALARGRGDADDLRLYLLDISHTMLSVAYRHAKAVLKPTDTKIYALHANFHEMARYPILRAEAVPRRRRLYTLFGGTMANLDNEVRFFQQLAQCAAPDDLCALDFQLAFAPPDQPDEIRRLDPPLANQSVPQHRQWLIGPIERHCQGAAKIDLRVDLTTHCPVPGSYELDYVAQVRMRDGVERQFLTGRNKRYTAEPLAKCLEELGWDCLSTLRYGVGTQKTAAMMLLRKR